MRGGKRSGAGFETSSTKCQKHTVFESHGVTTSTTLVFVVSGNGNERAGDVLKDVMAGAPSADLGRQKLDYICIPRRINVL